MAELTGISWCHHTMNFWIGCTRVSPGCDHCYAERQEDHRLHRVRWGDNPRYRTSPTNWKAPFGWNAKAAAALEQRRVFTLSLGDFWDNQVDPAWRADAFNVIRQCDSLDWLILTKRPQNIRKMLPPDWGAGWAHVWLGVTVENMAEARRRIPLLLRVPATCHFLSCEPLLEPLDLRSWLDKGIDWVICGGESGPGRRFMEPNWARDLRDQCAAADTAFHLKQMTGGHREPIPDDLMVRELPDLDE
jgi:protein gp37